MPIYSLTSGVKLTLPENFKNNKSSTVCISGHREKSIIPYKSNPEYYNLTIQTTKYLLARYLEIAYSNGYDTFINGFAIGADLWASEHIIKMKQQGSNVKLIGAIPYLHHADKFPKRYIDMLCRAEKGADEVVLVEPNPDISYSTCPLNNNQSSSLYRDRNYFMVDHSSAIIAFYNKNKPHSGTAQTIKYALKNNLDLCNFGIDAVYELIAKYDNIEKIKLAIQNIV